MSVPNRVLYKGYMTYALHIQSISKHNYIDTDVTYMPVHSLHTTAYMIKAERFAKHATQTHTIQ